MKNYGKLTTILIVWMLANISISFAVSRDLPWIDLITRAQWWANESRRYSSQKTFVSIEEKRAAYEKYLQELKETDFDKYIQEKQTDYKKQMINDYLYTNYTDEQQIDGKNTSYKGNNLWWTEYTKDNKSKLIVHHTAEDSTALLTWGIEAVKEVIRNIYKYHTFSQWWWDIGYNFLIDPFGNIYEWRSWGEWTVGAHDKWNNTASVWISLLGNFDVQQPTNETLDALVKLLAVLAKKYNIDPLARTMYHEEIKTAPYITSSENYTIAWHRDAGSTSCPGENIYTILPTIRQEVKEKMKDITLVSASNKPSASVVTWTVSNATQLSYKFLQAIGKSKEATMKKQKNIYIKEHKITLTTPKQKKIIYAISQQEAKELLKKNISVLLYELSTRFNTYKIVCKEWCTIVSDTKTRTTTGWTITTTGDQVIFTDKKTTYTGTTLNIHSKWLITITNYKRKSYAWIARNTFRWSLIIKKQPIVPLNGKLRTQYVVINELPIADYLKGIVETNDTEGIEKNKVMAIIAKTYALFYMKPENKHPSIPSWAEYTAIDHPDIFQKYVGAWLEKTLKKWPLALEATKDKLLMYSWNVPILPYFSCSAGFTWSAGEKRWRNDTAYLASTYDPGKCDTGKFSGHGVGLSGKWAQYFAKNWRTYTDILAYYYPGTEIVTIK